MASLGVPEPYRPGLELLGGLDGDAAARLLNAVQTVPPAIFARRWMARVAEEVGRIPPDNVRHILEAGMSLYVVRSYLSLEIADLADQIAASTDLKMDAEQRVFLKERIISLLSTQTLYIVSKASGIVAEESHTFHDARIITELRPIFGDNPSDNPAALAITHLLKIEYHEGEGLRDFYVLLSENGPSRLKDVLVRAEAKQHSLRKFTSGLGVTVLGAEEDD